MIKLDRSYSDYTELTDPNYPNGKAVDCSTDESYDGTPILKELVNDLHGALEAVVKQSAGNISGVSGNPDNINSSDFKDALMDLIETPDAAHAALRGPDAHGATVAATPGQLMTRDTNGRSQVANPSADADIANKGWVLSLRQSLFDAAHPIGSTYTQYGKVKDVNGIDRTMSDPETVFNQNGITSSWVELNYDGAFFRGNGGLSETFDGGLQPAQLPNVKGELYKNATVKPHDDYTSSSGAFAKVKSGIGYVMNNINGYYGSYFQYSSSTGQTNSDGTSYVSEGNSVYKDGGEVRPSNYTVKVWLRTA